MSKRMKFNEPKLRKKQLVTVGLLLAIAALGRLIPHPANFTPIIAIGLFGASYFKKNKLLAMVIPLLAMVVTDFAMNFMMMGKFGLMYPGIAFNYLALAGVVVLGSSIYGAKMKKLQKHGLSVLGGNFLFFIISNFGVWATFTMYPNTATGLIAAYTAAVPFLLNQLAGTLVWYSVLFGSKKLAEHYMEVNLSASN